MPAPDNATTAPNQDFPQRHEPWADVARGLAILLVVLLHVREWHYLFLDWHFPGRQLWDAAIALAGAARMPTFFAVSGLLAARAAARPWTNGAHKRIVNWAYLYVLWLAIIAALSAALPDSQLPQAFHGIGDAAAQLVVPKTALWYLWALAAYFLVARASMRINIVAVLSGAAILGVIATSVAAPDWSGMWLSILKNLVFFLIGARLPQALRALSDKATPTLTLILGATYLAAQTGLLLSPPVAHWFGLDVLVGVIAIAFAVTASTQLTRIRWLSRPVSWIGRRTSAIFLMQTIAFLMVNEVVTSAARVALTELITRTPLGFIYPALMTAGIAAGCLLAGEVLRRYAPLLMQAPRLLTGR